MNNDLRKNIQNFLYFYNNRRLYADQNDDLLTIDDYNVFLYSAINLLENCVVDDQITVSKDVMAEDKDTLGRLAK
jgi:hypothetical protein